MALISNKMIDLLQRRIKNEEFNSKSYASMANWLELQGFMGAAKLWKTYVEDEKLHKQWAVQFLLDLNILPIEPAEEQPQTEFKGLPQIIALTYKRELDTTKEVQELAKISLEEGDFMVFGLAQKYIAEQVEELAKAQFLLDQLDSFGDDKIALRLLDERLGELAQG